MGRGRPYRSQNREVAARGPCPFEIIRVVTRGDGQEAPSIPRAAKSAVHPGSPARRYRREGNLPKRLRPRTEGGQVAKVHGGPLAQHPGQSPAGEVNAPGAAAPCDLGGRVHEQRSPATPADLRRLAAELHQGRLFERLHPELDQIEPPLRPSPRADPGIRSNHDPAPG